MNINIKEAIKFPFSGGESTRKIVLLSIMTLVLMMFSGFFSAMTELPIEFMNQIHEIDQINPVVTPIVGTSLVFTGILGFFFSLLLIPLSLYIYGYQFQFLRGVMHSSKDPLPEHDELKDKLLFGLKKFLLELPLSIIVIFFFVFTFLTALISVRTIYSLTGISSSIPSDNIFLFLILGVLIFALVVAVVLAFHLIQSAIYFNFLNGSGVLGAFSPTKILQVLRAGWKPLLKATFASFLISTTVVVINIFLICFSFIVYPVSVVLVQLITTHIFGQAYSQIKKRLG